MTKQRHSPTPLPRFNLVRDQYRSSQAGTDKPVVPNAGVVMFGNW